MLKKIIKYLSFVACVVLNMQTISAQPEWMPWGNIKGIRIEGELMKFETSLRAVDPDWGGYVSTEKYNWEGQQTYIVGNKMRTASHALLSTPLEFTTRMIDAGEGKAIQEFDLKAMNDINTAGIFYCFEIPGEDFIGSNLSFYKGNSNVGSIHLEKNIANGKKEYLKTKANRIIIESNGRKYEIKCKDVIEIIVRQDFISQPHELNDPSPRQKIVNSDSEKHIADYQIYFAIAKGKIKKGFKKSIAFDIATSGKIDTETVDVKVDITKPGRSFDGISGNYRWQFPEKDPMVIKYLLDSLRVSWGRVAFFWDRWQPEENMDPIANAKAGKLDEYFVKQIELTRLLVQKNIPIIISVWTPPTWAIDTNKKVNKGVVLDNKKLETISKSIASYLKYIKEVYGIDAKYFSFNEPDYGVEVRMNKEDHAIQYKAIGEYFASQGLLTKILIGDTGAGTANASDITSEIIKDPKLHSYAAAIAFHTYHGCTKKDLVAWAQVANTTNLPIMVAEGGTNSAAHRYPLVFLEEWFQLGEIDTYIRICNQVQPFSIMEWQLTSDYSVLTGQGLYGDNGHLRPTMRYWILKQLGMSPFGAFWIPASTNKENVSVAANADIANGLYTVHLVNNGATRMVSVSGLPKNISEMRLITTNIDNGMKEGGKIKISEGKATFQAEKLSFVTLTNVK